MCSHAGPPAPESWGDRMRRFVALLVLLAPTFLLAPPASATDRDSVDAYLREVASQVRQPGVYVDPLVVRQGKLTGSEIDAIRARALRQTSTLHILVLPASKLAVDHGGVTAAHLAYTPTAPAPGDRNARHLRAADVRAEPSGRAVVLRLPVGGRRHGLPHRSG